MRQWDIALIHAVNGFAGHSLLLDLLMSKFLVLDSVKTLPLTICIVWLWFKNGSEIEQNKRRVTLIFTLAGMFSSIIISAFIQDYVISVRPIYDSNLHLTRPFGLRCNELFDWNSFPSDHAAVAFSLALGLLVASRGIGIFAIFWALFVTSLPRVYDGLHYPSDIFFGALIGICTASVCIFLLPKRMPDPSWLTSRTWFKPALGTMMFVILFGTATMFKDARLALTGLHTYLSGGGDKWIGAPPVMANCGNAQSQGGTAG